MPIRDALGLIADETILLQWVNRAKVAVNGITAEDALVIGVMCFNAERRDENCGVWHQAALWYRNGVNCNCVPCRRAA